MDKMANYTFIAGFLSTALAMFMYAAYALSGIRAARMQTAGTPMRSSGVSFIAGPRTSAIGRYATMLVWLSVFVFCALGVLEFVLACWRRLFSGASSRA